MIVCDTCDLCFEKTILPMRHVYQKTVKSASQGKNNLQRMSGCQKVSQINCQYIFTWQITQNIIADRGINEICKENGDPDASRLHGGNESMGN